MVATKSQISQTRIRLTREGWVYLTILAFVSIGAVLRNINLLIILSGMMLAPMLLGWRLCVRMMLGLELQRNLPVWVHACQKFDIEWECENPRDRIATWSLNIKDRLRENETQRLRKAPHVTATIPQILPGQTEFANYQCLFPKRGKYLIGPAEASTRFPLGLIKGAVTVDPCTEIYVAPVLGDLIKNWDKRVQSHAYGERAKQRRRGTAEEEFYSLREWRSGDSSRQIHWRSSAKLGKPVIKQFDQKSDRDFALVVDLYGTASDVDGVDGVESEEIETLLSFSATMFASLKGAVQGNIALAICGAESFLTCDHFHRELASSVMQNLATAEASNDTRVGESIKQLFSQVSAGTPVLVVSTRPKPDSYAEIIQSDHPLLLSQIEQWTRWIQVGTPEFAEIFRLPNMTNELIDEQISETVAEGVS